MGPELVARWLFLSLWFSIQSSPRCCWRSIWCDTSLRCVCRDPMNYGFMIRSIFLSMKVIWVSFDLLYAWLIIASYFFYDICFFGQLDLFILKREEVLCDGFDLTVLNPSDRRGGHVCIVAIKDNKMGSIPSWTDLVYIMSSFLLHYSIFPWT